MPRRIVILHRVIIDIRIPIPRLGALALKRDDAVRLGEAANIRVISLLYKLLVDLNLLHHSKLLAPSNFRR